MKITRGVGFTLRVVQVDGGYASERLLEGRMIGRRKIFPTMKEAIADTEVARESVVAALAAKGIVVLERPRAKA